jgi:hypothetical protein
MDFSTVAADVRTDISISSRLQLVSFLNQTIIFGIKIRNSG